MTVIILGAIALALVLIGIWHEDKLIAFEDELWERIKDRIAYAGAHVVVWYKNKKAGREVWHVRR
jgi:hypothetical protein